MCAYKLNFSLNSYPELEEMQKCIWKQKDIIKKAIIYHSRSILKEYKNFIISLFRWRK